ncbi:MAG: hypothetical protein ACO3KY_09580 [Lysobacterales bacterium]|jgi:hypothetical protein
MKEWIQRNLVLISGIVLPMLLVAGFFILNQVPRALTEPPQHDFLLVIYRCNSGPEAHHYLEFDVQEGHLTGRAVRRKDENSRIPWNRQRAGIFRYNASDNTFSEFVYEIPNNLNEPGEPLILELGLAGTLALDKRRQSPDGFSFQREQYRGGGGLLGSIFGMGRYERPYVLRKGNADFELDLDLFLPDDFEYCREVSFMGWIMDEEESP